MQRAEEVDKHKKQLDAVLRENLTKIEYILRLNAAVSLGHVHSNEIQSNGLPDCQIQSKVAVEELRQCIELAGNSRSGLSSIISLLENGISCGKQATHNALKIENEDRDSGVQIVNCCNIKNPQKNAIEKNINASVVEFSCEDHDFKNPNRAGTGNPCFQSCLSNGTNEDFFVDKKQIAESSEVSK